MDKRKSYAALCRSMTAESFVPKLMEGIQDYASQIMAVVRTVHPWDYFILVVIFRQLAELMYADLSEPRKELADELATVVSPTLISTRRPLDKEEE